MVAKGDVTRTAEVAHVPEDAQPRQRASRLDPAMEAVVDRILAEKREERNRRMRNNAFATIKPQHDPPRVRVRPAPHVSTEPPQGRLYMRRHTHQHTFALGVDSFHQVRLFQNWQPGLGGAPDAEFNHDAHTEELGNQLRATDRTLAALHAKNEATIKGLMSGPGTEEFVYNMRQRLNDNVTEQMRFFSMCCEQWAGVPMAHRAHAAQHITGFAVLPKHIDVNCSNPFPQAALRDGEMGFAVGKEEDWDARIAELYANIPPRPDPYPPIPV